MLNPLFLSNPAFALDQVLTASTMLGDAVQEYFDAYLEMIVQDISEQPDRVRELGEKAERYVAQLRKYCLRLSQQKMQDKDATTLSLLSGAINNYAEMAEKITAMKDSFLDFRKDGNAFSDEACRDLNMFGSAVQEILGATVHDYSTRNTRLAGTIQVYREVITDMLGKINRRSVRRLHSGICSQEGNIVFSEICTGYERIIYRCDSIARHILRTSPEQEVPPTQEQYDRIKALFEDKFAELD
jgi:phosphate:Na+ symporter